MNTTVLLEKLFLMYMKHPLFISTLSQIVTFEGGDTSRRLLYYLRPPTHVDTVLKQTRVCVQVRGVRLMVNIIDHISRLLTFKLNQCCTQFVYLCDFERYLTLNFFLFISGKVQIPYGIFYNTSCFITVFHTVNMVTTMKGY